MFAVIGLGNPGPAYAGTRHNAGFRVVEALSRATGASPIFYLRHSLCALAEYQSRKIILSQPLTYMNLSGKAVLELMRRYKLGRENLLIIHDDMDLPLGTIRLRDRGGSAGHKGVLSIIEALGDEEFIRMRFGIGAPPPGMEGAAYVLEKFTPAEEALVEETVAKSVQAVQVLLVEGLEAAMNRFNTRGSGRFA